MTGTWKQTVGVHDEKVNYHRKQRTPSWFLKNILSQIAYTCNKYREILVCWARYETEWGKVHWPKMIIRSWHIRGRDILTCAQIMAFITRTRCVQCTIGVNFGTNAYSQHQHTGCKYARQRTTWPVRMITLWIHWAHFHHRLMTMLQIEGVKSDFCSMSTLLPVSWLHNLELWWK